MEVLGNVVPLSHHPEHWDLEGLLATYLRYKGSVPNCPGLCLPCSSYYEVVCRRGERGSHLPHPLTTPSTERKELGKVEEAPTSEHDTAKDSVVPIHGGAVPAVVAELVLTLSDPFSGTLAHRAHDVWVTLAQLPLPAHQTRDVVTDHSGPQRPDVPARRKWPCQSIPALLLH